MGKVKREIIELQINRWDAMHSPAHLHNNIELIYVLSGTITATCDGVTTKITAGQFYIVAPNQVHHYEWLDYGVDYYCLIVNPRSLAAYAGIISKAVPETPCCTPDDASIVPLIEAAHAEYLKDSNSPIVNALLTAIFGKLLRYYNFVERTSYNDKISDILNYCNEHFTENITVEQVANELFISRCHFSHLFNDKLNLTFKDYINRLRVDEALRLVESKGYSITDAAFASGFSTIRTFNRAFKKLYEVSPSEYLDNITPPKN